MITYDRPINQIVELKWESVVHGGGSGCVGGGGGRVIAMSEYITSSTKIYVFPITS